LGGRLLEDRIRPIGLLERYGYAELAEVILHRLRSRLFRSGILPVGLAERCSGYWRNLIEGVVLY
jgi:hypothetical protein